MAATPTYFDQLFSFIIARYTEAGIPDNVKNVNREEMALTLNTYLNSISNGLSDPVPTKDHNPGKPTRGVRFAMYPEVRELNRHDFYYSSNRGRKCHPHVSRGRRSVPTGVTSESFPCPKCPPTTGCPNKNITTILPHNSGPLSKLGSVIYALDLAVHNWVASIFPPSFSWSATPDGTISPAELTALMNLITLAYTLHTLRETIPDLSPFLTLATESIHAFSGSLSFLTGILVHIARSRGGADFPPTTLPYTPVTLADYRFPVPPGGAHHRPDLRSPEDFYASLLQASQRVRATLSDAQSFASSTLAQNLGVAVHSWGSLVLALESSPDALPPSLLCPARLEQVGEGLRNVEISLQTEIGPWFARLESLAGVMAGSQLAGWDFGDEALSENEAGAYAEMLALKFGEVNRSALASRGGWMRGFVDESARLVNEVGRGYKFLRVRRA
ncbi:hypothetical protein QBC41DRAFT_383273 [Cercophora samala]|uniref:Uncharacterized protein n=1 Tax=Cercophora samala TaxID=330535 RepID=A0AA40D2R0_9PEZI|nr:hypothetical protein QBC41DRAFT_383273 [Cercophora samala]